MHVSKTLLKRFYSWNIHLPKGIIKTNGINNISMTFKSEKLFPW